MVEKRTKKILLFGLILYLIIGFIISLVTNYYTLITYTDKTFIGLYLQNVIINILIILFWPLAFGLKGVFT